MSCRSSQEPSEIIVDDRERSSGLIQLLQQKTMFTIEARRLEAGDILIRNTALIERKTVQDMVSSILNGRLESQLNKLVAQRTPARMVILEGPLENPNLKGFSLDELRICILTIHSRWKIQVILSQSLADTVNWIRLLVEFRENRHPTIRPNYRGSSRTSVGTGSLQHRHDSGLNARPFPLHMKALTRIPGLGQVRASKLLELFGSIHQIRARRIEELTRVDGIETELAHRILEYLE